MPPTEPAAMQGVGETRDWSRDDGSASHGSRGSQGETKTGSVLLVAFHLPVILNCVDPATNEWTAEWDRDNPFTAFCS